MDSGPGVAQLDVLEDLLVGVGVFAANAASDGARGVATIGCFEAGVSLTCFVGGD